MENAMKTLYLAVSVLCITACSSETYAPSPKTLPPGEYTRTEKSVNELGTETKQSTKTTVYEDATGERRAVRRTETTRDPKGWFNESTSKTITTY